MCLVKAPKIPPPPAPPEIPAPPRRIDQDVLSARARQRRRSASAFGASATVLTGGRGLTGQAANVAGTSLLASAGQSQEASVRRPASETPGALPPSATLGPDTDIGGISDAERRRLARIAASGIGGLGGGAATIIAGAGGGGTIIGGRATTTSGSGRGRFRA